MINIWYSSSEKSEIRRKSWRQPVNKKTHSRQNAEKLKVRNPMYFSSETMQVRNKWNIIVVGWQQDSMPCPHQNSCWGLVPSTAVGMGVGVLGRGGGTLMNGSMASHGSFYESFLMVSLGSLSSADASLPFSFPPWSNRRPSSNAATQSCISWLLVPQRNQHKPLF